MSGRIVQTGIGVAVSAALNQQEKEKASERKARIKKRESRERHKRVDKLISVGDKYIDLKNIANIETYNHSGVSNGYLRFVPKNISVYDKPYESEYFIYNCSIPFESKKIKARVEAAKNSMLKTIANAENIAKIKAEQAQRELEASQKAEQVALQAEQVRKVAEEINKVDVFEEIRKYKKLLDEDIITAEEFSAKKKELLGL